MRQVGTVVVLLAMTLAIRSATAGDATDDLKAFQGTWDLVSFEREGKEVKPQNDTKAIITGHKTIIKVGDKVIAAGTFKLDPGKKPKAVDLTYTAGPDKGKTFKGIYQFDGDQVKFCRPGSPDDDRPTEFKTKVGSRAFVSVYKRAKQ
jgi:uncharacterized protein (TIGR03067 family)